MPPLDISHLELQSNFIELLVAITENAGRNESSASESCESLLGAVVGKVCNFAPLTGLEFC